MAKNKNLSSLFYIVFLLLLLPQCSKEQDRKVEDMSFDELKEKTLSALDNKKTDLAIENLEKLVMEHPDNQNIAEYKLQLANLYFDTGNLPSAYEMYEHFTEFYPSDPQAEFAKYRCILTKFYQTLKVDCDQSNTQETIKLCDFYLNNPLLQQYQNDVTDIKNTCERKLIDKEVYIYNFYLKKKEYKSAQNRLDYLRAMFLPTNPEFESRLLYLDAKLANKQKDEKLATQKISRLMDQFPDSPFTKMAQRLVNKDTFIF